MNKNTICVKGMHCRSCELIVEDELLKIPGVKKAVVSQNKGTAEIFSIGQISPQAVEQAIAHAGYSLGVEEKSWVSKNPRDWKDLVIAVFLALDLFLVAKSLGLFHLNLVASNNYNSLPIVFLIGLTAGISTCMALIGGLILGASAKFAEKHPQATTAEKFKPHLFFNAGRIVSYTIFGAIVGFLGSFFQLSTSILGILIIVVGTVMLLLGAQLLDVFPILRGINISLPKSISRMFGIKEQSEKEYSHKNAAVLGATTFFLPCAFTQAMVLFAMGSGNALTGALTLGVFAAGTAPGLLGVGGLTSVVKGAVARLFFKTAGIVVIFLALFNINNGYNLTGLNFNPGEVVATIFGPVSVDASNPKDPNVAYENGVQIVRMTQSSAGYSPNEFTIKRNVPVRWIINSTDANSCTSSIISAQLNIAKALNLGENIIEFTPAQIGTIRFSCSMGMFSGSFNVIDETSSENAGVNPAAVAAANVQPPAPSAGSSCAKSGGCGCGGGRAKAQPVVEAVPQTFQAGNVQLIKAVYAANTDIRPNKFTVKSGQKVRFEVEARDNGEGCMGSITIPSLTGSVDILTAGKTTIFEFTPTRKGNFPITCAMGVPRGEIRVD